MKPLTPMTVSRVAQTVLTDFLSRPDEPVFKDVEKATPFHINCGLCEDFAEEVRDRLGDFEGAELEVIWLHETLKYDDEGPVGFDHDLLSRLSMSIPDQYPEDELFDTVANTAHAVLVMTSPTYGHRFYDAQTLQGARSYFDMPLMQDLVGVLDDPTIKDLKVGGVVTDEDKMNDALNDYFERCGKARINDFLRQSKEAEMSLEST
jgi:hypothetical protein